MTTTQTMSPQPQRIDCLIVRPLVPLTVSVLSASACLHHYPRSVWSTGPPVVWNRTLWPASAALLRPSAWPRAISSATVHLLGIYSRRIPGVSLVWCDLRVWLYSKIEEHAFRFDSSICTCYSESIVVHTNHTVLSEVPAVTNKSNRFSSLFLHQTSCSALLLCFIIQLCI